MNRFLVALALTAALQCGAAIVEEKRWVSAKAGDAYGHEFSRDIRLTVFYEDSVDAPRPVVIINHGRAPTPTDRHNLGRARYTEASKWFVRHGYFVAVPTRIGYGETGGPDVEDSPGSCAERKFAPAYEAGAAQTLTVLQFLREWKQADTSRVVMAGQSFGGTTAITLASMNVPGVIGAINFAGGGGGRPATNPGDPCSPYWMKKLFETYGRSARIPTLWLYSENDEYWGPRIPRQWFEAFREAGGNGEFIALPPVASGGHGAFTKAPASWQPAVSDFLARISASFAATPRSSARPARSD